MSTAQKLLPKELASLGRDEVLVSEFFLSVQGESTHIGRPCFFVRLTGCHLRCAWCDSEYAFFGGTRHSVVDCVEKAASSGCGLVEVTGGEPLLQKGTLSLLAALCDRGQEVLLETSGSVDIARVDSRVKRIVDWKAPGSGMERHNRPGALQDLRAGDELKIVVVDRRDYEWAREFLRRRGQAWGREIPVHLSPAWGRVDPAELAGWILADGLDARLGLQLHKVLWGAEARGV